MCECLEYDGEYGPSRFVCEACMPEFESLEKCEEARFRDRQRFVQILEMIATGHSSMVKTRALAGIEEFRGERF